MNEVSMPTRALRVPRILTRVVPIVVLSAALQACGGGGSDSPGTSSASSSSSGGSSNAAPSITGNPATAASPGQAYSFTPSASDPEGAKLTFTISGKPAWATFDAATGKLSGTAASGSFANISITVSDGVNITALTTFSINVSASAVTTSSATVSWSPPTARDDGTSLGNLAGYKIYYGTDPSDLSNIVAVNSAGVTSFTVDGLTKGTYYFTITALDAAGLESRFSNVASKTIS